jgi:hypothetical protein
MGDPILNGQAATQSEAKFLQANYRQRGARWCAAKLGRTVSSVYYLACKLDLQLHRKWLTDAQIRSAIRKLHPKGYSDSEIVAWLVETYQTVTDRHRIMRIRNELGLPINRFSFRQRQRVASKTREQLQKIGFDTLAQYRIEQWNSWKRDLGWPESLTVRAVQALEVFWQLGPAVPMTRLQLCQLMGISNPTRTCPKSNAKGGTVLAELVRAGFLVCHYRGVQGRGSKCCNFYYLKHGVKPSGSRKQQPKA